MIGTLLRNRRVAFGFVVLAALLLVAVFAPWLAPHDPTEQDLLNTFAPPAWSGGQRAFLFGTDSLGRDILSRLIYGARVALVVAVVAATLAGLLGTALGLAAGYLGGRVDNAISRLVDVWMSFPAVLLSIVLAAVLGAGLHTVIIAIVVIGIKGDQSVNDLLTLSQVILGMQLPLAMIPQGTNVSSCRSRNGSAWTTRGK